MDRSRSKITPACGDPYRTTPNDQFAEVGVVGDEEAALTVGDGEGFVVVDAGRVVTRNDRDIAPL